MEINMGKEKILNENEIELEDVSDNGNVIEDPDVIHINEHDYERVNDHDEDEDNGENFFERFFGKRPSEKALKKLSIASFVLGVLSCSLLLGNLITSVLGILLAVKNEKHKYRSVFSTAGFILSAVGLILGAILTCMIILVAIALLIAIFVAILMTVFMVVLMILSLVFIVLFIMFFSIGIASVLTI